MLDTDNTPCVQVCMLSSALYHTMSCHPSSLSWLCLDQSSILLALYGTSVRVIVTNFNCFPAHKTTHLFLTTGLFISALFLKVWAHLKGMVSRLAPLVLLILAIHSMVIMAHWVHLDQHMDSSGVLWLCIPYILAGVGVFFYLSHIPERLCCSEFDICGASHQIWHVFIFAGIESKSVTRNTKLKAYPYPSLSGMASWYWLLCWTSNTRATTCGIGVGNTFLESNFHNSTSQNLLVTSCAHQHYTQTILKCYK